MCHTESMKFYLEYREEGRAGEAEIETEEEEERRTEEKGERRERRGEGEAESSLFRTRAGKREPRPACLCRRERLGVGGACLLKGQCTDWEGQHNHNNMDLGDGLSSDSQHPCKKARGNPSCP